MGGGEGDLAGEGLRARGEGALEVGGGEVVGESSSGSSAMASLEAKELSAGGSAWTRRACADWYQILPAHQRSALHRHSFQCSPALTTAAAPTSSRRSPPARAA